MFVEKLLVWVKIFQLQFVISIRVKDEEVQSIHIILRLQKNKIPNHANFCT